MTDNKSFILGNWSDNDYEKLISHMYDMAEVKLRDFTAGLIPGRDNIIGIRIPALRALAKEIAKGNAEEYIALKKGNMHEEVLLEGFVIGCMKLDYPALSKYIEYFADKVDNWAISDCTSSSMKQIKKYRAEFLSDIERFINSGNPWHIRYNHFLSFSEFPADNLYIHHSYNIASRKVDFYYVQMAQAWCLATAMAKYREKTFSAVEHGNFSADVINMFIRKVRDSSRISKEDKERVLKLKKL